MRELGDGSAAVHPAVGQYAASRADAVVAVGEAAGPIAEGAGERAVALAAKEAAIDWPRGAIPTTWCSSRPPAGRASMRSPSLA
jgi:UDP-N-acetylmuramoyl-tripeptide--D-alanyl-D-alanine ligase